MEPKSVSTVPHLLTNSVISVDESKTKDSEYGAFAEPQDVNAKIYKPQASSTSGKPSYFTLDLSDVSVSLPVSTPQNLISTLVFFDLESTGLPHFVGKNNVQITELSFIAISRRDFEHSSFSDLRDIRIINKLSVCVKPRACISYGAFKVSGLDNYNLKAQQLFDKDLAQMIKIFISKLPKPTCLLAHSGNTFDFPLLKAEMERVGVQLPEEVLTADTLRAFRSTKGQFGDIPGAYLDQANSQPQMTTASKCEKPSFSLENLHTRFFGAKHDRGHSAEGDCRALVMVCHKVKTLILPWIYENTRKFNSFNPMW